MLKDVGEKSTRRVIILEYQKRKVLVKELIILMKLSFGNVGDFGFEDFKTVKIDYSKKANTMVDGVAIGIICDLTGENTAINIRHRNRMVLFCEIDNDLSQKCLYHAFNFSSWHRVKVL